MSFERYYPNNLISNIVGAYTHYWNKNYFNDEQYFVYRMEADKFAILAKQNNQNVDDFYQLCKTFADKIEKESLLIDEDEIDINRPASIVGLSILCLLHYLVLPYLINRIQKEQKFDSETENQVGFMVKYSCFTIFFKVFILLAV